jgi:hypothetical protein
MHGPLNFKPTYVNADFGAVLWVQKLLSQFEGDILAENVRECDAEENIWG